MFDFTITQPSQISSLFCCIVYYAIVIINWQRFGYEIRYQNRYWPILIGIILYAVTMWIPGDWFSYQEWVKTPYTLNEDKEAPYIFLRTFLNHNYLLFRIVVWGGAAFMLSLAFRLLRLDVKSGLFFFFSMFALLFSYARVSLAMAFFFLGYCLVIQVIEEKKNPILLLGGAALMVVSVYFHRSMIVPLALSLISLIPFKKKTILLYVILAAVFFYVGSKYFNYFLAEGYISNDDLLWKLDSVSSENELQRNLNGNIKEFLKYASVFVPFVCITFALSRKESRMNLPVKVYKLYYFVLFVIASALAMLIAFPNIVFFYRTLYMSIMPMSIILSFLYQYNLLRKIEWRLSLFTGIMFNSLVLLIQII